ncbi:MAG TPA: RdgB/HAM1 family non-canonical purine NTP pyrophosphatase [Vicinamibacterales bacterium]|nr:RdgB/HAM1 family non-canonical purine NTP pyrophosphatase [Vicinamibacterales bacterium]
MTRLLVATSNPDKLREIRTVLADLDVEILTLDDLPPVEEPEETGATFRENAQLKALYYGRLTPHLTVAEDSGLVIDALDGEPGVRSARFLRPDASYPERFAEIYRRLALHPGRPRTARFICALAAARDGCLVFETEGTIDGEIVEPPRGQGGFGYDPIFYHPPSGRTLAELGERAKAGVSHRGRAFQQFAAWLHAQESRTET